MRNPLFAFFLLVLMALGACTTAGNMGREIPRWFNNGKPVYQPRQGMETPAPTPAAAPVDTVERVPEHRENLRAHPAKVALLLPLSGSQAALGKNFLDAAQMAVMDMGGEGFELMPKDSGADPATAARSAAEAVAAGANLVIGPVFGTAIPAVRDAAPGVPILALSNDANMAGGNVYVMGFSPTEQVERIAAFAETQGVRNIAVLAPNSVYGQLVLDAIGHTGVNVVTVQRYQKNRESIEAAVAEIARQKEAIDGIFIPDGGSALAGIGDALMKNDISGKTTMLFGTGLWDDADISRSVALLGGFYAAPDPAARRNFLARFQRNYGAAPVRLATLAYDATALAAKLAAEGQGFDDAALTRGNGFQGLDGIFRLNGHVAERALAVMQVTSSGSKVVLPAADRF